MPINIERIPVLASVDPEDGANNYTRGAEFSENIMIETYSNGNSYATQRPGLTITNTPDFSTDEARGRGAYHWERAAASYAVVNTKVIKDGGSVIGFIGSGISKVHFIETDQYLVILDPANNQGWTVNLSDAVEIIDDPDFPSNQSPRKLLAGGGAWLNGTLFILDTDGNVWNSDEDDPRSWNALNFINAGKEEDGGLFLAPHAEGLAVFGTRTIEFFWYAGIAVGSPLRPREDTVHHVGAYNDNACTVQGDTIYFLGSEASGTLGVYMLSNYKLEHISSKTIDDALAYARNQNGYDFIISGIMLRGHNLCFISAVQGVGEGELYMEDNYMQSQETYVQIDGEAYYDTQFTLVFDATRGYWTLYDSTLLTKGSFPVVAGTSRIRNKNDTASVVFLNGEIGKFDVSYDSIDQTFQSAYFTTDDYIENQDDYIITTGEAASAPIKMQIRIPEWDGGTMTTKFGHRLEVVGITLANSAQDEPVCIRWSDDHFKTFSPWRTVSTDFRQKLTRLGKFKRRSHELKYEGFERIRIEALEMDVSASQYGR